MTSITLDIDPDVKNDIELYALIHHTTVSALTENYFKSLLSEDKSINQAPLTASLRGSLKDVQGNTAEARRDSLEEKYLHE